MEAIDADDVSTIQELRKHRSDLAHDLARKLPSLDLSEYTALWDKVDRTIFKLSNHRAYIDIGADETWLLLRQAALARRVRSGRGNPVPALLVEMNEKHSEEL